MNNKKPLLTHNEFADSENKYISFLYLFYFEVELLNYILA